VKPLKVDADPRQSDRDLLLNIAAGGLTRWSVTTFTGALTDPFGRNGGMLPVYGALETGLIFEESMVDTAASILFM